MEEIFDPLYRIQIPEQNKLHELLTNQNACSSSELINEFLLMTQQITKWLETAHMIAFTIEQNIKRDDMESYTVQPLENSSGEVQPIIQLLSECCEEQEELFTHHACKLSITKIQSEWSGLQHFISFVKDLIDKSNEKYMLRRLMENILLQIDDLSLMIFQFQEKRHLAAVHPSFLADHGEKKEDSILVEIDNRVGPLFSNVEKVYTRMTSDTPPEDNSGLLTRKHLIVQERWESLRLEIDELKIELKEDRWLVVFRQVADQVDEMMNGLEKTVTQYYNMIKDSNPSYFMQSSSSTTSTSSTSSTPVLSTSLSNTVSNTVDVRAKLRSVEKNFEAKYKYYTPSIAKMLMMLGNGIAARVSRNLAIIQRHEAMITRWNNLKQKMDQLRKRDINDIDSNTSDNNAHCWSRLSDRSDSTTGSLNTLNNWNSRYAKQQLSTSPSNHIEESFLEYSPSSIARSKSPYNNNNNNNNNKFASMHSPSPSPLFMEERTPRKMEHPIWRGGSPINNSNGRRTTSPSFYSRDNFNSVSSILRPTSISPSNSRQTSHFNLLSKSPDMNIEEEHYREVKKPSKTIRPITPNIRRSGTPPSMIPRPKTPTSNKETSNIARPRSSMGRRTNLASPSLVRSQSPAVNNTKYYYKPDPKDQLDKEVANIVNRSPIPIQCSKKSDHGDGKYYFGNELTPSLGGGKKIYTCKLMTYGSGKNKVLIRVGGGWQDLEIFLIEHTNLIG